MDQIVMFVPLSPTRTQLIEVAFLRIVSGVVISNIAILVFQRLH